jgi:DtxR family manganese transport transcriptional regulator
VEAIAELIEKQGHCRVTDLAARFGVSHVTVSRTVSRLSRDGLVATQPYGPMTLTEVGRKMAQESKKRHDLVYQFLLAIGVPESTAADDAEGIEHHVSAATLKCFREFLERS